MSSLSNLPYGEILDYWYEKYKGQPDLWKFLMLKYIEVQAFYSIKKSKGTSKKSHKIFSYEDMYSVQIPDNPKVGIVVPVFLTSDNDIKILKRLINRLSRQTYQHLQIIIVNDGSVVSFPTLGDDIQIYTLTKSIGPANARNIGKKLAVEGGVDLVCFTDSDCVPDLHWVEAFVIYFKENKTGILSGQTKSFGNSFFSKYHDMNGTLNGRIFTSGKHLLYGPTCNLVIHRDIALKYDFDVNFPLAAGEDIEFCFRVSKEGIRIHFCETAIVSHDFQYEGKSLFQKITTFRNLFKKYAKGEELLLEKIPEFYDYFNNTTEITRR